MLKPRMSRPWGWMTVLSIFFLVTACTPPGHNTEPTAPSPTGSVTVPLRTIANSEVGDQLTVTAALVTAIGEWSFVVRDVDLPDQGLLTLGHLPDQARPADLLTIWGVIDMFDFDRLARTYGLVPDDRYDKFHGRKILIAREVRSWARPRSHARRVHGRPATADRLCGQSGATASMLHTPQTLGVAQVRQAWPFLRHHQGARTADRGGWRRWIVVRGAIVGV